MHCLISGSIGREYRAVLFLTCAHSKSCTVSRALFENVKNQNASKFIKWLKVSEVIRFDQNIWYQFVGECIRRMSMPIWWSQSDQT